jgi:hypothetical protein
VLSDPRHARSGRTAGWHHRRVRTGISIDELGDLLALPIVIRLVPDRIRAWDFKDDVPPGG